MKRLYFSIFLILLASLVLLLSDLNQRKKNERTIPKVAILQFSSHTFLDDGVEGIFDGLKESGFEDGINIHIKHFNSEGDLPTANAIASEITSGKYDYALTVSTPALQAVANANKQGKVIQIFGVVTDPFIAGVGLKKNDPLDHPKHLVGYGSFLPVIKLIKIAKELYPDLRSIGLAWNAAEANSEAYTILAREFTKQENLKLVEVIVDSSVAVNEAVNSLVSRGVDMILVTGDNTVGLALDNVVDAASKGKIPVLTLIPTFPNKGTLLDLGADFYQVGKLQGYLLSSIINGKDPATIPIENVVPEVLIINKQVLRNLKDPWKFTDKLIQKADVIIDEKGKEIRTK
ncbi:MAG TPA: ABC transporter substrate-binding protein [Thermodesulfobacteriota bacterium]|nr:ABC transporter substrate-binding protein [Thermodesulfobacteriota bacterium]